MENVFTSRDAAEHKIMRSSVASKYSLSSMLQLEPMFDKCIPLFVSHMGKRAGAAIDFGEWLSWCVLLPPPELNVHKLTCVLGSLLI